MTLRIEHNELGLDEVVMEDCFFHLERMDDKSFWIGANVDKVGYYHINLYIENGMLKARIEKQ